MAIGLALKRMGMEDRYIIIRDIVNMDVFMLGLSPEGLWGASSKGAGDNLISEERKEAVDIFATSMRNNFAVGSVIVRAILGGWGNP